MSIFRRSEPNQTPRTTAQPVSNPDDFQLDAGSYEIYFDMFDGDDRPLRMTTSEQNAIVREISPPRSNYQTTTIIIENLRNTRVNDLARAYMRDMDAYNRRLTDNIMRCLTGMSMAAIIERAFLE